MKCLLCRSSEVSSLYTFETARVLQCDTCNFIFSKAKGREKVDKTYWSTPHRNFYDYYYGERLNGLHTKYIAILRRYGVESVLDIGAGLGYFVSFVREKGLQIEGYEPGKAGRDFSRKHLDTRLRASMPKKKYDAITMFHTLEHLPKAKQFVRQLKSRLTPDGIVLVEVPNQGSLFNRIRGRNGYDPYAHVNFFTKKTLEKLFIEAGFEILELKTAQSRRTTLFLSLIPFGKSARTSVEGSKNEQGANLEFYKVLGWFDMLFAPVRFLLSAVGQGD